MILTILLSGYSFLFICSSMMSLYLVKDHRKHSFKAMKLKFWFRLFAMFDVLFAERFELTTWNKKGEQKAKTKFCKTEIDNAGRDGLL